VDRYFPLAGERKKKKKSCHLQPREGKERRCASSSGGKGFLLSPGKTGTCKGKKGGKDAPFRQEKRERKASGQRPFQEEGQRRSFSCDEKGLCLRNTKRRKGEKRGGANRRAALKKGERREAYLEGKNRPVRLPGEN